MSYFRNIPIKQKLTLLAMGTSVVALLLAGFLLALYEKAAFKRDVRENTLTAARMMEVNVSSALTFNDPDSAQETLQSLAAEPNIVGACVYDKNGKVFAKYSQPKITQEWSPPTEAQTPRQIFSDSHFEVYEQIQFKGETLGTLYLQFSLAEMRDRFKEYALLLLIVIILVSSLAFVVSGSLQKKISEPISHLAKIAAKVAVEKDYSIRARKTGEDELGKLMDGFNEMLSQIQIREQALQENRDQLEKRVEERTHDLENSLSLVSATLESTADGIVVTNSDGKVTQFNEHFIRMWGLSQEIARMKNTEEMLKIAMARLKTPEQFLAKVNELFANPGVESFDILELKDGRIFERYSKPQKIGQQNIGRVWSFRDVTERKHAEIALRRTEEIYRHAITGAGAVPYSYDYQTKSYRFMGEGIERLIGYTPNEVGPDLWRKIVKESIMLGDTADLSKEEAVRRVVAGEIKHWRCDMRVRGRDGKFRWLSDASVQNLDEGGHITGSIGILQDITERKQAEITALAFSKLGQNLSLATSAKEAARVLSETADELFGWDCCWVNMYDSQEDCLYPLYASDLIDGKRMDVSEPEKMKCISERHRRVLRSGGELVLREQPSFTSDSEPFGDTSRPSASLMYVPIRYRNRGVGLLSIQSYTFNAYDKRDLETLQTLADQGGGTLERIRSDEALRKSESQFRLVWDSSNDGMRLANQEGIVVIANEAYCRMVGKTRMEVEGKPVSSIYDEENASLILNEYQKNVLSKTVEPYAEQEVILWNGKKIWFEVSNTLLELIGQPCLVLSIFRDVSPRKQAEAEMEIMHRQLLESSRQAGMAEVATGVLHNVGNVLNSVNVSAALVNEELAQSKAPNVAKVAALLKQNEHTIESFFSKDPRGKQLIGYLGTLAEHLTQERKQILDELALLQKNIGHIKEIVAMQQSYAKISGITETVKSHDMMEDALRMNGNSLARHRINVIKEYSDLPAVTVERHKVLQILTNLIRNAKFACEESGQSDMRITLRINNGGGLVRFSVIDNGVGITPENLTRIFAHGFTTRKSGHGFGLHSGALAAKELGGTLTAHSDGPGKGATFVLQIPYKPKSTNPNIKLN